MAPGSRDGKPKAPGNSPLSAIFARLMAEAGYYDLFVLLDPEAPEERRAAIVEQVKRQIDTGDASLKGDADWGMRRLSYEIDHRREAQYHLFQFEGGRRRAVPARPERCRSTTACCVTASSACRRAPESTPGARGSARRTPEDRGSERSDGRDSTRGGRTRRRPEEPPSPEAAVEPAASHLRSRLWSRPAADVAPADSSPVTPAAATRRRGLSTHSRLTRVRHAQEFANSFAPACKPMHRAGGRVSPRACLHCQRDPSEGSKSWQPPTSTGSSSPATSPATPSCARTPSGTVGLQPAHRRQHPPQGRRDRRVGGQAQLLRRHRVGRAGRELRPVPVEGPPGRGRRPPRVARVGGPGRQQAPVGRYHCRLGPVPGLAATRREAERRRLAVSDVPADTGDFQDGSRLPAAAGDDDIPF